MTAIGFVLLAVGLFLAVSLNDERENVFFVFGVWVAIFGIALIIATWLWRVMP